MKIRVSTLPPEGLKINDTIPLDTLNARMQEGRDNEILFTVAPEVSLTVFRTLQGAETKGTVRSKYTQPCSRCNDGIEKDIEVEANFLLNHIPDEKDAGSYEDDIGISYYEGDHIELEELIQEVLILSLSLYWHPPVDKNDACVRCGKKIECQKSKEAPLTLGNLLEKARRENKN